MAMTDTAEFRSLDTTEALRNGYVTPATSRTVPGDLAPTALADAD